MTKLGLRAQRDHADAIQPRSDKSSVPLSPLIQIAGLEKRFTTRSGEIVKALTNVNLDIADHEFISVVGPSGCGKTTLLRILAGLESASSGDSRCRRRAQITGRVADVGVVFQQATLLPWNHGARPTCCFRLI